MKFFALGASRNIGYGAALRLMKAGHSFTFLLRNPSVFDGDANMTPYIASKQAQIVKGDALSLEDIQNAWKEAEADGVPIDYVIYSVGTY
jgi:NAD(P)-dependent dehydrogenase (short-subunit alcohol dehydrogenase family)